MEKVDDSNYLQQNWADNEFLHASDDLQEILSQFESTAYLKDLNLFGGDGDKTKHKDPVLSMPDVSFLMDDDKDKKRKLKDSGKDVQPLKKGKKMILIEEPVEALTEGDLAKRRESHNATERRRREKINEKIDELRKLLPGGGKGVNKAAVLHQTAERMKSLQVLFNRLLAEKRRLESSRNELLEDVYRLRTTLAHFQHTYGMAPHMGPGPNAPAPPPGASHQLHPALRMQPPHPHMGRPPMNLSPQPHEENDNRDAQASTQFHS